MKALLILFGVQILLNVAWILYSLFGRRRRNKSFFTEWPEDWK